MHKRIIDLTFPLYDGMKTFPVPWHQAVEITILGRHGIENRETRKIVIGTHTGTHCDAPRHFVPGGRTLDKLPLGVLIGEAFVIDFSYAKPFQEMGINDFQRQMRNRKVERLVIRYDWSDNWGNLKYYTDHPFMSVEAAQWLMKRGVKLLAMDTPTPDDPKNGRGTVSDSPIHKLLLNNDIILVEYLCNLKALNRRDIELIVLPLKIHEGDGAPARCVAME